MTNINLEKITQLKSLLKESLARYLPPGQKAALLDFPNHFNVGDNMIWLGEIRILAELKVDLAARADYRTYDPASIKEKIGEKGVVLIHGGGNFGDLWPKHEIFRRKILKDFEGYKIIQLPQTVDYSSSASLAEAAEFYSRYKGFTMMVRGQTSVDIARNKLALKDVQLVPDMAFALGDLSAGHRSNETDVILSRTDHEASEEQGFEADSPAARVVDWIDFNQGKWERLNWVLINAYLNHPRRLFFLARFAEFLFDWTAGERVAYGISLLADARKVITNRLHGCILAFLMGIPVEYGDTKMAKLSRYIETWLKDCETIKPINRGKIAY